MEQNNQSSKFSQIIQKGVMPDYMSGQSVKQYNPATYPVKLSFDYKPTLNLILSSLDFIIQVTPDFNINTSNMEENLSEDPMAFLEISKINENQRNKEGFKRYYAFTRKLAKYFNEQRPDPDNNVTIPITGEEYMLSKSIMMSNLIAMQNMAEKTDTAVKNQNYAKTMADYAKIVSSFLEDKDVEVDSNDVLIISYSLYYSITKQWQQQAEQNQNYSYLKPEEAMSRFSQEDIDNFIKNINNPVNPLG